MKQELYAVIERIDSAISRLSAFHHPLLDEIIQRDLVEAKEKLDYLFERAD
jgi:hypothetical protein